MNEIKERMNGKTCQTMKFKKTEKMLKKRKRPRIGENRIYCSKFLYNLARIEEQLFRPTRQRHRSRFHPLRKCM